MLISVHVRMFQALAPFVFCLQQIGKRYINAKWPALPDLGYLPPSWHLSIST